MIKIPICDKCKTNKSNSSLVGKDKITGEIKKEIFLCKECIAILKVGLQ